MLAKNDIIEIKQGNAIFEYNKKNRAYDYKFLYKNPICAEQHKDDYLLAKYYIYNIKLIKGRTDIREPSCSDSDMQKVFCKKIDAPHVKIYFYEEIPDAYGDYQFNEDKTHKSIGSYSLIDKVKYLFLSKEGNNAD